MVDAAHKHTQKYVFQACDSAGQNCSNAVPVIVNAGIKGAWGRGAGDSVYAYDGLGSSWKYDASNNLLASYALVNGYGFGVGDDGAGHDRMVAAEYGGSGFFVWDGDGNFLTRVGDNNNLIAGVSGLGSAVFATEPMQGKVVAMNLAQASPVLAVAAGVGSSPMVTTSTTGCGSPNRSGFSYSPTDGIFGREDFGVDSGGNPTLTSAGSVTITALTRAGNLPQYVGGWSLAATDASSVAPCTVVLIGPVANPDGSIGRTAVLVDGGSMAVKTSFSVRSGAMAVAADSPRNLFYVANVDLTGVTHVSVYDITGTLVKTLTDTSSNAPAALTVSADGQSVGICDGDNQCAFLSTQSGFAGDVVTYHYNNARLGFIQHETSLTLSNVNSNTFGLLGFLAVDGKVDAQPLYLSQLQMGSGTHNVLYVVTENDSVYAFDADGGQQLWKSSAVLAGEAPSDDIDCDAITPQIGITDTPVIDRQRGAIYFVAMTKDSLGIYHQRLHALDIATGAELFGGPAEIVATYPGNGDGSQNGRVIFDPKQYAERIGLLESKGKIISASPRTVTLSRTPHGLWPMTLPPSPRPPYSISPPMAAAARSGCPAAPWPPTLKVRFSCSMGTAPSIPLWIVMACPSMATTETACSNYPPLLKWRWLTTLRCTTRWTSHSQIWILARAGPWCCPIFTTIRARSIIWWWGPARTPIFMSPTATTWVSGS